MKEVLRVIAEGESLDRIGAAAREHMQGCCRALSGFAGTDEMVKRLCFERWWCETVFSATVNRGLDDELKWRVVKLLPGCVDGESDIQKTKGP